MVATRISGPERGKAVIGVGVLVVAPGLSYLLHIDTLSAGGESFLAKNWEDVEAVVACRER